MIRVLNADDHPMLRKGVSHLLKESPGIDWVGSAENGYTAQEKISDLKPDIALLDLEMPKQSGIQTAIKLISAGSKTKFVLLTLFRDTSFLRQAINAGIKGYLLKDSSESEIIKCIETVHNGGTYIDSTLSASLVGLTKIVPSSDLNLLSKQERNIVKLISMNKTSKEIATMLFLSPKTIANHRRNISKKLNLSGEQNSLLKWVLEHKKDL